MPERPLEQQLDLFVEKADKPPERSFGSGKIFSPDHTPPKRKKPAESVEFAIARLSHPKLKLPSDAWEDLHGKNN